MTTASEMITKLETALSSQSAGVVKVKYSDREITFSREQALRELRYWTEAARAAAAENNSIQMTKITFKGQN